MTSTETTPREQAAELAAFVRYDEARSLAGHDYGSGQRANELIRRRRAIMDLLRYEAHGLSKDARRGHPETSEFTSDELEHAQRAIILPRLNRVAREVYRRETPATRRTLTALQAVGQELERAIAGKRGVAQPEKVIRAAEEREGVTTTIHSIYEAVEGEEIMLRDGSIERYDGDPQRACGIGTLFRRVHRSEKDERDARLLEGLSDEAYEGLDDEQAVLNVLTEIAGEWASTMFVARAAGFGTKDGIGDTGRARAIPSLNRLVRIDVVEVRSAGGGDLEWCVGADVEGPLDVRDLHAAALDPPMVDLAPAPAAAEALGEAFTLRAPLDAFGVEAEDGFEVIEAGTEVEVRRRGAVVQDVRLADGRLVGVLIGDFDAQMGA